MVDAQVPELDTDVGTGTEGDVEARCFSTPLYVFLIYADLQNVIPQEISW
jgi:hypothetical protein